MKQLKQALANNIKYPIFAVITTVLSILAISGFANSADDGIKDNMHSAEAVFAGGCFWCTEAGFEKIPGVTEVISGYMGGHVKNPKYKQVSSGTTGHIEVIKVIYNDSLVSYDDLLDYLWRQIDPTDNGGQFVDRGAQYRPAIFIANNNQQVSVDKAIDKLNASGRYKNKINIDVLPETEFYAAEDYHQNYYKRNPLRYKFYRYNSGRDQYLKKVWTKDEINYDHNSKM